MSDTPAAAASADALPDLFAVKDPALSNQATTWSPQARPLRELYGLLRGGLLVYIAADLALTLLKVFELWAINQLESGAEWSEDQVATFDALSTFGGMATGGAYTIVYLFVAFMFLRFIYRALQNLHLSRARGELMGPGWAVAYNFIPIMNLWKPHQAMRQIWRSSHDPRRGAQSPPGIMWGWWLLWLVANLIANASFRLAIQAGAFAEEITDFELYKTTYWLDFASTAAMIPSVLFLLPILRQITEAQDAMRTAATFEE